MLAAFLLGCSSALAGPLSCRLLDNYKVGIYITPPAEAVAGYFLPLSCTSKCINVEFGEIELTNYSQIQGNMVLLGGIVPFTEMDIAALPANQEVLIATLTFEGPAEITTAKWVLPGQELRFQLVNAKGETFYQEANDEAIQKTEKTSPPQFRVRNYPNPFNPQTSIVISANEEVRVTVYNTLGQKVRTLFNGKVNGDRTVVWDGKNETGDPVSTGVYFVRLAGAGKAQTITVHLVK